eukprot:Awhi_evm1s2439
MNMFKKKPVKLSGIGDDDSNDFSNSDVTSNGKKMKPKKANKISAEFEDSSSDEGDFTYRSKEEKKFNDNVSDEEDQFGGGSNAAIKTKKSKSNSALSNELGGKKKIKLGDLNNHSNLSDDDYESSFQDDELHPTGQVKSDKKAKRKSKSFGKNNDVNGSVQKKNIKLSDFNDSDDSVDDLKGSKNLNGKNDKKLSKRKSKSNKKSDMIHAYDGESDISDDDLKLKTDKKAKRKSFKKSDLIAGDVVLDNVKVSSIDDPLSSDDEFADGDKMAFHKSRGKSTGLGASVITKKSSLYSQESNASISNDDDMGNLNASFNDLDTNGKKNKKKGSSTKLSDLSNDSNYHSNSKIPDSDGDDSEPGFLKDAQANAWDNQGKKTKKKDGKKAEDSKIFRKKSGSNFLGKKSTSSAKKFQDQHDDDSDQHNYWDASPPTTNNYLDNAMSNSSSSPATTSTTTPKFFSTASNPGINISDSTTTPTVQNTAANNATNGHPSTDNVFNFNSSVNTDVFGLSQANTDAFGSLSAPTSAQRKNRRVTAPNAFSNCASPTYSNTSNQSSQNGSPVVDHQYSQQSPFQQSRPRPQSTAVGYVGHDLLQLNSETREPSPHTLAQFEAPPPQQQQQPQAPFDPFATFQTQPSSQLGYHAPNPFQASPQPASPQNQYNQQQLIIEQQQRQLQQLQQQIIQEKQKNSNTFPSNNNFF